MLDTENLEKLDFQELNELIKTAEIIADSKKEEKMRQAYQDVSETAEKIGCSIEDILEAGKRAIEENSSKYRDPKNKKRVWKIQGDSPRGRRPKWVGERIDEGYSLESMKVNNDDPKEPTEAELLAEEESESNAGESE